MIYAATSPSFAYPPEVHWRLRPLGSGIVRLWREVGKAAAPSAVGVSEAREGEILHRLIDASEEAATNDGILVSPITFRNARDFVESLPQELPLPTFVVESNEEIGLDWDEGADKVVSLTIDTSNRIGFSALLGSKPRYGKVDPVHEFSMALPDEIQSLLEYVHPSAFN